MAIAVIGGLSTSLLALVIVPVEYGIPDMGMSMLRRARSAEAIPAPAGE